MGGQSVSCLQRVPALVLLGEPGLTPLDLPGRAFRVRKLWRPGLVGVVGRLGVFVSVTVCFDGEWKTCIRFRRGHGFSQHEDLFRLLSAVELTRLGQGVRQ